MLDTAALDSALTQAIRDANSNTALRARTDELEAQWAQYLHTTHAPHLNAAQAATVYVRAYETGHAGGYTGIESEYIDLAVFAAAIVADR